MAKIQLMKDVESAARMFGLGQQQIEEKLLDLAIAHAKMQAYNWEVEERHPEMKPTGKSLLITAWAWYIPRNRPRYQTPVKYVEHSLGGEPAVCRIYRSGKKLVCPR